MTKIEFVVYRSNFEIIILFLIVFFFTFYSDQKINTNKFY